MFACSLWEGKKDRGIETERENGMFCPSLGGKVGMCVCSETLREVDRSADQVENHLEKGEEAILYECAHNHVLDHAKYTSMVVIQVSSFWGCATQRWFLLWCQWESFSETQQGWWLTLCRWLPSLKKEGFFYFSCEENSRGTSGQSAYLKILSLVPKLFAFLVKWSLEGAFSVLFSSLGTLWFI